MIYLAAVRDIKWGNSGLAQFSKIIQRNNKITTT